MLAVSKADKLVVKMDWKDMQMAELKAAEKDCVTAAKLAVKADLKVELMVGLERNWVALMVLC